MSQKYKKKFLHSVENEEIANVYNVYTETFICQDFIKIPRQLQKMYRNIKYI